MTKNRPNQKLAQRRDDRSWDLRILEINGVNASIENWREILLSLLSITP